MEPGTFYHYYNRGNNRENIFREEANYLYFLRLLKKYVLPVADVYSYCLLSNHFHLIIKTKEELDMPEAYREGNKKLWQPFSNLFNAYAKAFNKKYDRTGSLFQKMPKQLKIEENRYLMNLILYVNTNPSHHGIAEFDQYAHSSYPKLSSIDNTALKRDEVHELFGGADNFESALRDKEKRVWLIKESFLEDD